MKKPVLATMGVIGACAACCTIPLAVPLLSGLSVAGLASIDWESIHLGREAAAVGAGLAAATLVGGSLWWNRRRKAAMACAASAGASGGAFASAPASAKCGCSSTALTEASRAG